MNRVDCSNSVKYDWVQVLNYSKYWLLVIETPEQGWRMHQPKCYEYNNEDNSPNILSDKIIKLNLRNLDK